MASWQPDKQQTAHIVTDMQRLFAEDTPWHTPALAGILPNVRRLAEAFAGRNHFAKFMVPPSAEAACGRWQAYYQRWAEVTTSRMDPAMLDVVAPLRDLVEPERVIEKPTYSFLQVPGVRERLQRAGARTLVFTGVETDVCILAGVFDAVDAGFHAVVVRDAVGSASPAAHDAVLAHVLTRLPDQVEIVTTRQLLDLCEGPVSTAE